MKKLIAFFLVILLLASATGCAGTTVVIGNCTCPTQGQTPPPAPAVGNLKTGLAIITGIGKSKDGVADYDVSIAAVTVDDQGIIRDCVIDSIGTSVKFDATGNPAEFDPNKAILTKTELGSSYGMVASGSKYEWYQQADALAQYAVGKTVAQLRSGAVGEAGKPTDADLAASASIYLGGYVDAIEKAVNNAKHLGANAGDTLKLAVTSSMKAEAGLSELNTDVVALTMKDGVITSCALDAVQAKVTFSETGTLTADTSKAVPTKNELGAAYGMVQYAGAKFEWNEQAANFAAYVTGKTPAQVAGIAVSEEQKPADADLLASVTIKINGFQALIAKAAQ